MSLVTIPVETFLPALLNRMKGGRQHECIN